MAKKEIMKLNDKHIRFCQEYIKDLNGSRAYRIAYKSCKKEETANVNSSILLNNTKIKAYINELLSPIMENNQITAERILKEYASLAFYNIKQLYNPDGSLLEISNLTDEISSAIVGVDIAVEKSLEGSPLATVRKYKFSDKKPALDALAKYIDLFNEKNKPTDDKVQIVDDIK